MFRLLTFVGVLHLVGLAANFVNGSFTNEVQSSYLSCELRKYVYNDTGIKEITSKFY